MGPQCRDYNPFLSLESVNLYFGMAPALLRGVLFYLGTKTMSTLRLIEILRMLDFVGSLLWPSNRHVALIKSIQKVQPS